MTPKRERFCQEYLIDLNATQAAIRAGYAAGSADVTGVRLLGNASVAARVQELMEVRSKITEIDAQWVLKRLAKIADFDIRKLYHEDGRLKTIPELDDNTAYALAGMDVIDLPGDSGAILKKYKATDKKGALELIGKHLAMFTEKVQTEVTQTAQVIITIPDNGRDPDLPRD